MTSHTRFGVSLALVSLLFGASATASDKDARTVKLFYPAVLGGAAIQPGEYQLKIESHSPEVTLTFIKEGKVVVKAHGKWEEHGSKLTRNTVVYDTNRDGSESISQIRLRGMKEIIVLDEFPQTAQGSGPKTAGGPSAAP